MIIHTAWIEYKETMAQETETFRNTFDSLKTLVLAGIDGLVHTGLYVFKI